MKKEFAMLFKKKYIYIIIIAVLMVAIMLISHLVYKDNVEGASNVYSNYIETLDIYNTKEELQQLYNDALAYLEEHGPGGIKSSEFADFWEEPPADYFVAIYKFLLDNDLPYDSLVDFSNIPKYTSFNYYTYYTLFLGYAIVLSCVIIGAFYQTGDVMTKMSKMVYSSGKKRLSIIDAKYGVSLIAILAVILLSDIIMAIAATSLFPDSGAKYCIMYTGSKLLTMNFFEFFMLNLTSHLLMATLLYTSIYYLSVMLKNGIFTVCASFVSIILLLVIPMPSSFDTFIAMWSGYVNVLYMPSYYTEVKNVALIVPYVVGAVAIAVASRFVIKKMDYSR